MKIDRLFVVVILLLITSCQKEVEDCEPPPCPRPNLNLNTSFLIECCVSTSDTSCYTINDLMEVRFIAKTKSSDEVVIDTIFNEFELMNYSILIGGESEFKFGADANGTETLEEVEYYYEIELASNSQGYTIDAFKFKDDGPCSCPSYTIETIELNEQEIAVDQNKIILKNE